MDPSTSNNTSINASHLQHANLNTSYPEFLGGIQSAATTNERSNGNDDFNDWFHPDLFDNQDDTPSEQQQQQQRQPQNFQSAFNAQASRQSQSPALPAYNPTQQTFTQPQQYHPQTTFDPRTYQHQHQQSFDPRLYPQRPSQSPAPMEPYSFQNTSYPPQNYQQQQMNFQQRPSATPTPSYSQQPSYSPYGSFDSRPQLHMPTQTSYLRQFQNPEQSQKPSQNFVNPNMLNAGQDNFMNGVYLSQLETEICPNLSGQYSSIAQRPIQASQIYPPQGTSLDPRFQSYQGLQAAAQNLLQASAGLTQIGKLLLC